MVKETFQRGASGITLQAREQDDLDGLGDRARALRARYMLYLMKRAIRAIARAAAGILAGSGPRRPARSQTLDLPRHLWHRYADERVARQNFR